MDRAPAAFVHVGVRAGVWPRPSALIVADARLLQVVTAELTEGVVLLDDGRVRFVNDAAARLLELEPPIALGQPAIWILRDHRLEALALRGLGELELETRGRRLLARAIAGGLLLRDITDLRRAQEDARELLAVLSHELRTPVTAIRGALEALAVAPPESLRRGFVERALSEAERLGRLLEDLTVEARPPRARSLALLAVAQRALSALHPTLEERKVQVEIMLPEFQVWADEDKLLQVLVNLIENAAVHGPASGTVALKAWVNGERLHLEVQDEGVPLDRERVEALFQPHTRGGSVKAKGTGLGLYIVRSIAERWGGEAWGGGREDRRGNAFGFSVPTVRPTAEGDRR